MFSDRLPLASSPWCRMRWKPFVSTRRRFTHFDAMQQ
jgi:hypothetical protein